MNTLKFKLNPVWVMAILCLSFFTSCSDDDDEAGLVELEVQTANDIPANPDAPRGTPPSFTFFDLETGQTLSKADSNSTKWDLAFAGTSILTNGGISGPGQGAALIMDGIFESFEVAPSAGYQQDAESALAIPTGSGNGWYNYTGQGGTPVNAILPIPGKVIMLKTGEGNYAKIEILSYYRGSPDTSTPEFADFATRPDGRYYSFRYVVREGGVSQF